MLLLVAEFAPDEQAAWLAALRLAMPRETIATEVRDRSFVEVALAANPEPGQLRDLPNLRLVQSLWAGIDRLLADPVLPNVPLCRMVDPAMADTMAEAALAHVLWLHRGHDGYARAQLAGIWRQHAYVPPSSRKVGVLGLGVMGGAVASRLANAGFDVAAWVARPRESGAMPVFCGADAFPVFLARSEIVVNLLPLTPATMRLLDAAAFAAMPASSTLVNLGRGQHVVEADLLAALDAGQLRHAVLDVLVDEPVAPTHWAWAHPHVTVLPHVAAPSNPASCAAIVAENLARLRGGQPLLHLVERGRGY